MAMALVKFTILILLALIFELCNCETFSESRLFYQDSADPPTIKVLVDVSKFVAEVDERFLSIALDTSLVIKHWKSLDFSSERLNTLAHGLSPAYLRLGGNAADFLVFRKDLQNENLSQNPELYDENYDGMLGFRNLSQFYMSAHDLDVVNKFALRNGLHLLFDFNVLLRDSDDQWNSSNARDILAYSIEKGFSGNLIFSLGNEPNSFPHAFNRSVSATQLAKDFMILHHLLHEDSSFAPHFRSSVLAGPDITQPKKKSLQYLSEFLSVGPKVNAVTFHQYYIDGRTATIDDMMSLDVLEILTNEFFELKTTLSASGFTNFTLWLGETSSCWGGGARGLSDRYVAGFMWMDKLGQSARNGLQVVIRQAFYHGHYALISNHLDPNPDYWMSWLFKNLVGNRVFKVEVDGSSDVRLYLHCAQHPRYDRGTVVIYGLNLGETDFNLTFDVQLMNLKKHLYWLLPHGSHGLKSTEVKLYGSDKPLKMIDDTTFPNIQPVVISAGQGVPVAEHSFGFIVFPDSKVAQCL